ncbi:MAG: NADPH-dependent reductase [Candidatus Saccharibacteria bacterium]|nr:NADPH-dependent reductase [Candidatus Saccharibacteria bacterium]
MTTIAVLVGSLQEKSFNKRLAKTLENVAPEGVTFKYVDINMPLYNQDLEANYPESAQAAKDIIGNADGVLILTPEYNRSIPGVLKNAIDWVSRPYGTNSFAGKPTGVVGISPTPVGTAMAQASLRPVLAFLETKQLGQPEVYVALATDDMFDEQGIMTDERWRKNLTAYMETFAEWVRKEA